MKSSWYVVTEKHETMLSTYMRRVQNTENLMVVFSGKNIVSVYGAATRKEAETEAKRMNDMHKRNGNYYWEAIA